MALKGKIYSLAKQREDIDSRNVFESMINRSAGQNGIVMDGRNLAAGSIFADQISAGAITTGKIKADAVTADEIKAGAITTGHLAANSVNAEKIFVDELSAITSNIGTITAGIIRSKDNSIHINLNTGIIDLSKPLTINSKPVATSEQVTQAVDGVDGKVTALSTRMSNAELKIEPSAIITTVTGDTTFKDVKEKAEAAKSTLDSKRDAWDAKIDSSTAEQIAEQKAQEAKSKNYGYRYYERIVVHGDSDKYYPVIIKAGDQNVKRDIFVRRGFSEQAPSDWYSSTHKGGLTLKIKTNFGGWGGANYSWEIHELEEMYSRTFAGAQNVMSNMAFAIFLRGGGTTGAVYHLYSDQSLSEDRYPNSPDGVIPPSPQVALSSNEWIGYSNSTHNWKAPSPRTLTASVEEEIRKREFIKLSQDTDSEVNSLKTTTIPQLTTRVNTAEQKITDKAIVSTVMESTTYKDDTSRSTIISKINQTAESVSIDASNINLTGKITIASFGADVTSKLDGIESDASTAKSTASSAQSTANTAKSTADTAKSTASTAKTTADNASSTASTAKATADTASSVANTARSTANTANTAASNALTRVTIHDTRNENETPAWYYDNYPMQIVQEFKSTTTMGIGASLETYGTLLTTIPWSDSSGGRVKQEFKVKDRMFTRDGSGTTWTAWSDSVGDSSDAKTKTDKWSWGNTTEIDGGSIRTKTITTDQIKANSITSTEINVAELSAIASNIGTVEAGLIKSRDESIIINLDEGLITLGKPLKIQGKTVATEDDISSLGYGDIISKSGQEIFTDQAEDSAVHVEVDGKSIGGGSGNNLLPVSYGEYQTIQVENWGTSFVSPLGAHFYLEDLGLKVGDTVTISSEIKGTIATRYRIDDQSGYHVYTNTSNYVTNGRLVATFKIAERTTEWFSVRYDNQHQYDGNMGGVPYNIEVKNQMIEKGSTATTYEPPAPTPDYPIEIHSLNDFDVVSSVGRENLFTNSSAERIGSREFLNNNDWDMAPIFDKFGTDTEYTLSFDLKSAVSGEINAYAQNGNGARYEIGYYPLQATTDYQRFSITFKPTLIELSETKALLAFYGQAYDNGRIPTVRNVKMEIGRGSGENKYIPNPTEITPDTDHPLINKVNLSLSEPLRSVGDVKDRIYKDSDGVWKIERNVGEKVVDGNRDWIFHNSYSSEAKDSYELATGVINSKTLEQVSSNMFMGAKSKNPEAGYIRLEVDGGLGYLTFSVTKGFFGSLADMKNHLNENNLIVHFQLANPTIETLGQADQDKLNTLKSFKGSNYVYTVNNTEDLSNQAKKNLIPTLHATFKGSGWLPKYNAEQARIDLLSETNDIRNNMDNLVTSDRYNLDKGETDQILSDYQAAIDVARRELNGLVNEDGELILGEDGKPLQKGVVNEVMDLLDRTALVEVDYGKHSEKLKFMDTEFVRGAEGMFIGDTETRTGIMISPRVEETTEHEARASRIDFLDNDRVVAYISSYMMEISRGIFVQSAQIGEHKIETIGDGHTTFQWTPK